MIPKFISIILTVLMFSSCVKLNFEPINSFFAINGQNHTMISETLEIIQSYGMVKTIMDMVW